MEVYKYVLAAMSLGRSPCLMVPLELTLGDFPTPHHQLARSCAPVGLGGQMGQLAEAMHHPWDVIYPQYSAPDPCDPNRPNPTMKSKVGCLLKRVGHDAKKPVRHVGRFLKNTLGAVEYPFRRLFRTMSLIIETCELAVGTSRFVQKLYQSFQDNVLLALFSVAAAQEAFMGAVYSCVLTYKGRYNISTTWYGSVREQPAEVEYICPNQSGAG